jgi:hypothetical protein
VHQSERAFRAHATGPQVKRRAGLTGSYCRGAGHEEGEKEGSKGLPGQNSSKGLYSLLPRHGVHRACHQDYNPHDGVTNVQRPACMEEIVRY